MREARGEALHAHGCGYQSSGAHTPQWNVLSKHHNLCPGFLVFLRR